MLVQGSGRDTVGDDVVVNSPLSLKKRKGGGIGDGDGNGNVNSETELIKEDHKLIEVIINNAKSISLKNKMQEWLDENQ